MKHFQLFFWNSEELSSEIQENHWMYESIYSLHINIFSEAENVYEMQRVSDIMGIMFIYLLFGTIQNKL